MTRISLGALLLPVLLILHASIAAAQSVVRTVPGDYPTIQAAIDAANPGDTVFVGIRADGTFSSQTETFVESVRINKPLGITAMCCSACGPLFTIRSTDPGEAAVTVALDEGFVRIYGLGIVGGSAGLRIQGAPGVIVECDSVVVRDSLLGIEASGGGTVRVLNSLVSGCRAGIVQLHGGRVEIYNTEVSGGYWGIVVGGEAELELSDSTITRNALWPILTITQDCLPADGPPFSGRVEGWGNRIRSTRDALLCPVYPGEPWPDGFVDLEWGRAIQEAAELLDRGDARYEAEDYLGALACYEEALAIVEQHPYPVLEAWVRLGVANAQRGLQRPSYDYFTDYSMAREVFCKRGMHFETAKVDLERGRWWREAGSLDAALRSLTSARDVLEEGRGSGSPSIAMRDLLKAIDVEIASVYAMSGRYDEALHLLTEALGYYWDMAKEVDLARTEEWIGVTLEGLGGALLPNALEYLQRARDGFAESGRPVSAARVALRIGKLLLSTAVFDPDLLSWAREEFEWAFDVFESSGLTKAAGDAAFWILLAEAYEAFAAGHWDEALDLLAWLVERAVWYSPDSGLTEAVWGLAAMLYIRGKAAEEAGVVDHGLHEIALDILDMGLGMMDSGLWSGDDQSRYSSDRMRLLHLKGVVLDTLGRLEAAAEAYQSSVEIAESMRRNLSREPLKAAWDMRTKKAYERLIDLRYRMGQGTQAFPYAERSRARTFLDILYGGGVQPDQLISAEAGVSVGVVSPEAIDEAVDQALAYLEPSEAVLSYFVTETGVYLWVIAWNEQQRAHVVSEPVLREYPRPDLLQDVVETRRLLETPFPTVAQKLRLEELLKRFYNALVLPGLASLPDGVDTLVLVPSGPLWYVPFAALLMTDQPSIPVDRWATRQPYLVERYTVAYLPSVASLPSLLERTEVGEGIYLGLADPELTEDQLQQLGTTEAQYRYIVLQDAAWAFALCQGGQGELVYVGTEATEGRAHEEAPGHRVVVYAAHGQFNPYVPLQSGLYLAPSDGPQAEGDRRIADGAYQAWEILLTDHRGTELVVLAACESLLPALRNLQGQLGVLSGKSPDEIELTPGLLERITTGDEVVGMARAFLSSGAHSVLGTLWQANPVAIEKLLASACRHRQTGLTWAQALRQAQVELINSQDSLVDLSHPWFWAPFQLVGRWR